MQPLRQMGIAALLAASGLGLGLGAPAVPAKAAQVKLEAELGQAAISAKKTRTI